MAQPCHPCPTNHCADSPFDRVVVSYLIRGGAVVQWELLPTFTEPMPYRFQLQVGRTPNPNADDWEDVGLPVENSFLAVNGEQRVWGKTNWTHYRVRLETSLGVHYSLPVNGLGTLDRRSWRLARETVRQELVRFRVTAGQPGYLLKRRVTGTPCPRCLDFQTEEVRDPNCVDCYGTGFACGYFFPIDCV